MKKLSKEALFDCLRSLVSLPVVAAVASVLIQRNHAEAKAAFLAGGELKPFLQELWADRPVFAVAIAFLMILLGIALQCVLLYKKKADYARLNLICSALGVLLGGLLFWILCFH